MIWNRLIDEILEQRNRYMLWIPVFLGCGISVYFLLSFEPSFEDLYHITIVFFLASFAGLCWKHSIRWVFLILAWVIAGFLFASYRTHSVSAPVLGWRYYGTIEGNIVGIDKSSSNKPRLTLTMINLDKISKPRIPKYIRVSLHAKKDSYTARPGDRIRLIGSLSPPAGAVEPGGFDFQKMAWFKELGAVGYTRKPVELLNRGSGSGFNHWVFQARMKLSNYIQMRIPGAPGAFATALLTGDRSKINQKNLADLRASNLAHLLAISGLHMGLLTGIVFNLFRYGLSLYPAFSLRFPIKKIAAFMALIVGLGYLIFSGMSVSTQRAFIMVAVMLGAILLNRPAISLRSVSIAAIIILIRSPESLVSPGFQMSFAATISLIVVFSTLKNVRLWNGMRNSRLRFLQPVIGLLISSLVAGFATAPFAAYHFNQVAHYGLIANLISLPVMGMIIMPSAVFAGILAPFNLDVIPFFIMGKAISLILLVANWVSKLNGAVSHIPSAGEYALPFIVIGAIGFILLSTALRKASILLCLIGVLFWSQAKRPEILISSTGRLIGIMTQNGRILNRKKGNGFFASNWLANDGDARTQKEAASLKPANEFTYLLGVQKIRYIWQNKLDFFTLKNKCKQIDLLIVPTWKGQTPKGCRLLGYYDFEFLGSLAISETKYSLKVLSAREASGRRLWNKGRRKYKRIPKVNTSE